MGGGKDVDWEESEFKSISPQNQSRERLSVEEVFLEDELDENDS